MRKELHGSKYCKPENRELVGTIKKSIEHWTHLLSDLKDEGLFSEDILNEVLVQFCFMMITQVKSMYKMYPF